MGASSLLTALLRPHPLTLTGKECRLWARNPDVRPSPRHYLCLLCSRLPQPAACEGGHQEMVGVGSSPYFSPNALPRWQGYGGRPHSGDDPWLSDRHGFGILGREVNSCFKYGMKLSVIFPYFFHIFLCFYDVVLLLFYICNGNGSLET